MPRDLLRHLPAYPCPLGHQAQRFRRRLAMRVASQQYVRLDDGRAKGNQGNPERLPPPALQSPKFLILLKDL